MTEQGSASPHDSGVIIDNSSPYSPPIPSAPRGWDDSDAGIPSAWPDRLRSYVATIASLTYPAGVLYAEEFLLLHNQAWADAAGTTHQGQRQRGHLSADVWQACQSGLSGKSGARITSSEILRTSKEPSVDEFIVSLSPLNHGSEKGDTSLLVQLFPRPCTNAQQQAQQDGASGPLEQEAEHAEADRQRSVPLDEHPFFHRFGEMLPCGLAILDRDAQAIYVNQVFYTMTTHRESNQNFYAWPESIHPEDKQRVLDAYREAFAQQRKLRTEFRTKSKDSSSWRLLLLTPLGDENLRHVSLRESGGFLCCIVDITSEKSAELAERKAAKEAEDRRSALTSFIDMVSHEIRNPLSAVLHCSEDINEALDKDPIDSVSIRDAIETIDVCVAHQKNIVDDVLSFSKLDASMLTLVPSRCRPAIDIADLLKMFQPELRKSDIALTFDVDPSYDQCRIAYAQADLPRIGQILINLMSNAIKFTARSPRQKQISVSVGASETRPTSYPAGVVPFNLDDADFHLEATNAIEWGGGETLYLTVAVQDTGIGISTLDQQKLFERFRQATPKTAETYGGSGLGLNISRKLCQLHGGEIGVSAKEGFGSTFAFFIKIKRDTAASTEQEQNANRDRDANELDRRIHLLNVDRTRRIDRERFQTASLASKPSATDKLTVSRRDQYNETERSETVKNSDSVAETPQERAATKIIGEANPKEVEQASPMHSSKAHILLVEDNIINQRILCKRLRSKGYVITTANNGREAVDSVLEAHKQTDDQASDFDIILMDNEMPILDGNGATKALRDLERRGEIKRIPILGVTANVRSAQRDEMLQCGMDDVLFKPYLIDDMVKRIDKIFEENRAGRQ